MLTPEELGRPLTEHAQQTALLCWVNHVGVRLDKRLLWLHAIPNGGSRSAPVAGRLKSEGVRAGVWDLFLPVASCGWHGLYIEMKAPKYTSLTKPGNGLSTVQREFGMFVHAQGYATQLAYTWRQGVKIICDYLKIDIDA